MKIYKEESLSNFEFWSGAKDRAEMLTDEELDAVGNAIEAEDCDNEYYSETYINDLLWFDFDYVCQLIGLEYDAENDVVVRE